MPGAYPVGGGLHAIALAPVARVCAGAPPGTHEAMSRTDDTELRANAPHPESDQKVDSPTDLPTPSKKYVLRKTLREFSKDECTDIAAALTYYAVLAMFPAVIALLSLVSLVGQGRRRSKTVLEILTQVGAGSVAKTLQGRCSSSATPPVPASRSSSACSARCGRPPATSVRSAGR